MAETILALDLETLRLASEVEEEFAAELDGASPWARPDLFGFACGLIVDVESDVTLRIPPGEKAADFMVRLLEAADLVVSYNGESFDLGVLSAYRSVEGLRESEKHVDLCAAVRRVWRRCQRCRLPGSTGSAAAVSTGSPRPTVSKAKPAPGWTLRLSTAPDASRNF